MATTSEDRSIIASSSSTGAEPLSQHVEERAGGGGGGEVREVGGAGTWSLSSCKPGYGVQQLRDGNNDTYWQSDGQLPHLVNIQELPNNNLILEMVNNSMAGYFTELEKLDSKTFQFKVFFTNSYC